MPTLTPLWWSFFLDNLPVISNLLEDDSDQPIPASIKPTAAAIRGATEMMPKLVDEDTPAPHIYTGADGSLLLEWRPPSLKFKMGFAADGHLVTLKDDPGGQGELEYDVKDIEKLRRAMRENAPALPGYRNGNTRTAGSRLWQSRFHVRLPLRGLGELVPVYRRMQEVEFAGITLRRNADGYRPSVRNGFEFQERSKQNGARI